MTGAKSPEPRQPIGLLGGSFDPVHVGHLQLARDARDRLGLAEVRLIPAAQPWQKGPITDAAHRARMIALAIEGKAGLVLDMHEIERGGPTYTIDTLRALRAALGPAQPLVLVIGADQMARLDTWREWRALIEHAHIAVARRNAQAPALNPTLRAFADAHRADVDALRQASHGALVDLPMTPVDASATEIRALLSEPPSAARDARLAAVVPPAVLLYIRREHLYSPHPQLAPREKATPDSMDLQKLQRVVVDALEDVKAQDIKVFNTIGLSDMFDRVVLASGTSTRQSRALAWSVAEKVKAAGGQVISVEGTDPGEWVLVDLGDIVVHIMQPAIRDYYGLEEMWGSKPIKVKLASEARANRPDREATPAKLIGKGAVPDAARVTEPAAPAASRASTRAPAVAKRPAARKVAKTSAGTRGARPAAKAAPKSRAGVKQAKTPARKTAAKSAAAAAKKSPASKSTAKRKVGAKQVPAKRSPAAGATKRAAAKSVAKRVPGKSVEKKPAARQSAARPAAAKRAASSSRRPSTAKKAGSGRR